MNQRLYSNFINSINAEETKLKYEYGLNDFIKFVKTDNLLKIPIEKRLIDYILNLRKKKLSSSTVHGRLAAVYHFYAMNDVILNKIKINKYQGSFTKVRKDRAYTREEIHKLLDNSDLRMKVCILLMASGGMRLGAIPFIKLKHLDKNKITVYENSNEEYYTFVTPECSAYIEEYIKHRRLIGEKVTPEAHLIREHFDSFNPKKAHCISKHTIRFDIHNILKKCDMKLNVSHTHGFRKFFTTQLVNSKVNPEIREMLLGHKIGLASVYYKPTEQEMYSEYQKAINNLTINEENRLKEKIKVLEIEQNKVDKMENDIHEMKKMLGLS